MHVFRSSFGQAPHHKSKDSVSDARLDMHWDLLNKESARINSAPISRNKENLTSWPFSKVFPSHSMASNTAHGACSRFWEISFRLMDCLKRRNLIWIQERQIGPKIDNEAQSAGLNQLGNSTWRIKKTHSWPINSRWTSTKNQKIVAAGKWRCLLHLKTWDVRVYEECSSWKMGIKEEPEQKMKCRRDEREGGG